MPNDSFIHADIFFFMSSIALIFISAGFIVALIYLIRILRNVADLSDKVKQEGGLIVSDIRELRLVLREEGFRWKTIAHLIRSFFVGKEKNTRIKKK